MQNDAKYFKEYPFRYKRQRRNSLIGDFISILLFPVPCLLIILANVYALVVDPGIMEGIFLGVGLLGFIWIAPQSWRSVNESLKARIVPFFERSIESHAFQNGQNLARKCKTLDSLAIAAGCQTISGFGFNDDYSGTEKIIWHQAGEGIATIDGILSRISEPTDPAIAEVINELKVLKQSLIKAESENVRFCLMLRQGLDQLVSPVEMGNRKGSFW